MLAPVTRQATIYKSTCRGINFPDVRMRNEVLEGVMDEYRLIWVFSELGVCEERK